MIKKRLNEVEVRLLMGSLVCMLTIGVIYLSPYLFFRPIFAIFVIGIMGVALWEFFQLAKAKGLNPMLKRGITVILCYPVVAFFATQFEAYSFLTEVILYMIFLFLFLAHFTRIKNSLIDMAVTVCGLFYIVVPLSLIFNIAYFFPQSQVFEGAKWLAYLLFVTKATDVGAFFVGKKFGKMRLALMISPNKTIEGGVGGILSALLASIAFYFLLLKGSGTVHFSLFDSIWLGFLIGVFGQLGDLAESLLKRDAQIKHSNRIPGFGGVLDMVDSLIFTTPLVYFFLQLNAL